MVTKMNAPMSEICLGKILLRYGRGILARIGVPLMFQWRALFFPVKTFVYERNIFPL